MIDLEKYEHGYDTTPVCSCGSSSYFKNLRCGGWWGQTIENGVVCDTCLDSIWFGAEPKTVTCCECKKTIANPKHTT